MWVNGRLVPAEQAVVSAVDHGLTVGDGVFETTKVVGGTPFALRRHLERLARSAAGLGLPAPDLDEVRVACAAVLSDAGGPGGEPGGQPLRLRITYTAGPAPLGSMRGDGPATLVVAAAPMEPWSPSTAVVTVPWPRNERGPLAGLKTTSYADNVVALARARAAGAGEALLGDTRGRLSEGTGSNVFVVLDGVPTTPTLGTGCLAGVTRALVLEWTGARERDHPLEVLAHAEEVFLTSATRDVQAVHAVDGRVLAAAPGPVTREVAAEFARRSALDLDP